jgi:hypothetical protein
VRTALTSLATCLFFVTKVCSISTKTTSLHSAKDNFVFIFLTDENNNNFSEPQERFVGFFVVLSLSFSLSFLTARYKLFNSHHLFVDSLRSCTQSFGTSETVSESQEEDECEKREHKEKLSETSTSNFHNISITQKSNQKFSKDTEIINILNQKNQNLSEKSPNFRNKQNECTFSTNPLNWNTQEVIEWCQKIIPNFGEYQYVLFFFLSSLLIVLSFLFQENVVINEQRY